MGSRTGDSGFGAGALVAVLLVGVLGGAGVFYAFSLTREPDRGERQPGCARRATVQLAVDPVLYGAVVQALKDTDRRCVTVQPSARTGGQVSLASSQGAQAPDIWIADARFWMSPTYRGAAALQIFEQPLAVSPVVLVGSGPSPRPASWAAAQASGRVSTPDPGATSAGSLALVAPLAEVGQSGRRQAAEALVPFAQAVGDRRSRGLDVDVSPAALPRRSPRLVVATEQDFLAARENRDDLRAVVPATGAPMLQYLLATAAQAPAPARAAARRLQRYFASPTGAALLSEQWLRPGSGQPIPGGVGRVEALPQPPAAVIAQSVQQFQTLSIPSSILAVVDVSGSMDFTTPSGRTRVDLLVDTVTPALGFLPGHARVGLWVFSVNKGGPGRDWRVLEPTRRLDDLRFGRTQRFALRARAQQLPRLTGGGTGLYDTALAAYRQALRDYRPAYANAVVLLTDGANDDPGSIGLTALLARLEELRDPKRPVRIVGIGISRDADFAALRRIAAATGGQAYLAEQPEDILGVFAQALLSREQPAG